MRGRGREIGWGTYKQGDVSGNSDMSYRDEERAQAQAVRTGVAETRVSLPGTHLPR